LTSGGRSNPSAQCGFRAQPENRIGKSARVPRSEEDAGAVVFEDLGGATHVGRRDRQPVKHAFEDDHTELRIPRIVISWSAAL
jgi:hypothetical protein